MVREKTLKKIEGKLLYLKKYRYKKLLSSADTKTETVMPYHSKNTLRSSLTYT